MKQFFTLFLIFSFLAPVVRAAPSETKTALIDSITRQEKSLAVEEQKVAVLMVKLAGARHDFSLGNIQIATATVLEIARKVEKKSPIYNIISISSELILTIGGGLNLLSSLMDNTESELKIAQQDVVDRKQALAELKASVQKLD